jgi:hypothetical protein
MRHQAIAITAALLTAVPAWAADAAGGRAQPAAQTIVLIRTTHGPAWFHLGIQASLSPQAPHAFDGTFTAQVVNGRVRRAASLGAISFDYDADVSVRAQQHSVHVCRPAGSCIVNRVLAYSSAVDSSDKGGSDVDNRLYVVEEGPATVTFSGHGWMMRRLPMSYRWVRDEDADASGAFTGVNSVELFQHAGLAGGRHGSLASGAPPCSASTAGVAAEPVPRGAGTATLSGGRQVQSLTCPNSVGRPYLTGIADRTTSWSLDGPVVGDATELNVPLFVLDLPPRV